MSTLHFNSQMNQNITHKWFRLKTCKRWGVKFGFMVNLFWFQIFNSLKITQAQCTRDGNNFTREATRENRLLNMTKKKNCWQKRRIVRKDVFASKFLRFDLKLGIPLLELGLFWLNNDLSLSNSDRVHHKKHTLQMLTQNCPFCLLHSYRPSRFITIRLLSIFCSTGL